MQGMETAASKQFESQPLPKHLLLWHRTFPKLPLPRTLIKLKSLRLLLWICPFSLTAEEEDEEEEEVVEEEEEEEVEECWGPCWSSDSASCRRSNPAKSVGVNGKADQTSLKTG